MAVVATLAIASTIVGLALGLVPAVALLRNSREPISLAVGAGRGTVDRRGGLTARRLLIAGQVTVAMVLLFGAGLMFRSIAQINALTLGFRPDGVLKASVLLPFASYPDSADKRLLISRLLSRIQETDGVQSAAAVYPYPFGGGAGGFPVLVEGAASDDATAPRGSVHTVTPGYFTFTTMGIPLRSGRDFGSMDDHAAPLVVVISEGLARRIDPARNVIGRRIRVRVPYLANFTDEDNRPWRTIVGVVADTRDDFALDEPADVYVPHAQNPRSAMGIVVRARGSERDLAEPVRRAVAAVDPALALYRVGPLAAVVAEEGAQRRGLTVLLSAFALFSLALSALALYASLSYMVVQRRPELALRMAVGASAASILRLILGEGMLTTSIGLMAGAVASVGLGRVLGNQLYGVAPTDPATLASISLVLVVTVTGACVIPSTRAARIDPAIALRE
jgi:putative ABC transport system permease protein